MNTHQRYSSYNGTPSSGTQSIQQQSPGTYVVGPLSNSQTGGVPFFQAQHQNFLQHQTKSADFDEQALMQDYLLSQGLLSGAPFHPLAYQSMPQQQQQRSQSQIQLQIAMQQQQQNDMMMRKKQLSIDVTRQQQQAQMMIRAPPQNQMVPRGANTGVSRQQQPTHVPKKKSIISSSQVSGGATSSYKPSNIPSAFSLKDGNRKSLGGDFRIAESSSSSFGPRSKSISSQNEGVSFERQGVQVSQFNLKNGMTGQLVVVGGNHTNFEEQAPPMKYQNYMVSPSEAKMYEEQKYINYDNERQVDQNQYYHQSDFAQHSMLRVQRYEQMLQKQKNQPKQLSGGQQIPSTKGLPFNQAIPLNMQNLMTLNAMSNINEANLNFMPQIGIESIKQNQDFNQAQTQQMSFDQNQLLSQRHSTMFNQIQGLPIASQFQTQSSNSSSSGNISSSWLSQSQSSQQQTKIFPNAMATVCQSQDINCQCTSCLKVQMAQLQQMLFQQQQLINQQTQASQNMVTYQGIDTQKLSQGSIQLSQAMQPSMAVMSPTQMPAGSQAANLSNYQNQSSSVWASSASQLSPQSQTVTSVHSSLQSVAGDPSSVGIANDYYSSDAGGLVRMMTGTTDSLLGGGHTFQDPRQLETYEMSEEPRIATRGNEDETIVEERKSSNENTEESIPDEIEHQMQQQRDEEEMAKMMYSEHPNAMRVMYQGSEVVGEGRKDRLQLYYPANNEIDGSGGDTSTPYWVPIQTQNVQQVGIANKKNYIELPMGEIPEMKESFYDEVSRWSQVLGNTSQSRTKTPNGTNRSHQNLQVDQSNNTNSSNNNSNKDWQGNTKNQITEEDKEDLFLYSQGESGATFNRTENESSFLTSEKNKINSCLRGSGDQFETQVIKPESPSFEALKEMNMSKTSKTLDKRSTITNNLLQQNNSQLYSNTKKEDAEENEGVQLVKRSQANSIEKKRAPPEYSASSAKYMNQSLTFTPSQQQTPENQQKNQSIEMGQKDFPHIVLNYDQLTPIQNRKANEDIDKAYEYLNNQVFAGTEQSLHNHKLSVATQDCKILDEGLDYFNDRRSSDKFDQNQRPNQGTSIKSERAQQQREIILSPLPPMPFSAEDTPEEKDRKVTHQNFEQFVSVRTTSQLSSHLQSQNQDLNTNHNKSRQNSLSYEKDRTTKIINYILNSDQKQSGHHTMKSSIISRGTSGGYHRPNVLSQVNHIFPNLDEVFNTADQGLRTTKHVQQHSTGEKLQSIKLETLKPTSNEEVLMWTASISNTPEDRELDLAKLKMLADQSHFASTQQQTAPNKSSADLFSQKLDSLTAQTKKVATISDPKKNWQSRNLKSQTQKIAGSKILSTNSVFDFNQRMNSLENAQKKGARSNRSDERRPNIMTAQVRGPFMIGEISKERRGSKSPFGIAEKQKYSRIGGMVLNKSKGRNDQQRPQKSHSPIRDVKQPSLFTKQQSLNFNQTAALAGISQANSKSKKLILKKQSSQATQNQAFSTTPQPFASRAITQLSSSTSKQPQQISSNKYLPSMFDRLKKKQDFSLTQKLSKDQPIVDNYYLLNNPGTQTSRNESGKRVISSERNIVGQNNNGETRNSSCSSGANNSGSRKRKFSKIVFEISELPTVSAINRSLSMKRQRDQLNGMKPASTFGMIQLSQKDQQAIRNRIEKEQKSIGYSKKTKSSISPKRVVGITSQQAQGIQVMQQQQQHVSQLQSSNRSYNSSSEFIVTHENFQIRQMANDEAAMAVTSSSDFATNGTYPTLMTQESQNDQRTQNKNTHGPLQLQIQIQSRNQKSLQRQIQTEAPQPRVQNFIIETQSTPTQGESSKAIVQSLLTNNQNVSTTLSRLFGQKHRSKNQSLINESDETSMLNSSRQVQQLKDSQRSPITGYQTKQKQLSPIQKLQSEDQSKRQLFSIQPPQVSQNQAQKVCLPNSIFFNQTQKVASTNVLNQVSSSSKLIATNQIQLIKKPTHQRGSGGQFK